MLGKIAALTLSLLSVIVFIIAASREGLRAIQYSQQPGYMRFTEANPWPIFGLWLACLVIAWAFFYTSLKWTLEK